MKLIYFFWILGVVLNPLVFGCSRGQTPPVTVAKNVVEVGVEEVTSVENIDDSYPLEIPSDLTVGTVLRISGSYRPQDLKSDVPIVVSITRDQHGVTETCVSSATSDIRIAGSIYKFSVDTPVPETGPGVYSVTVNSGKRFIARGKIVVSGSDSRK